MRAGQIKLLDFLNHPQQFVIPIFQRTYSWELEHWELLWRDIIRLAENDEISSHFVGSIVYIDESNVVLTQDIKERLVIDGQQRLTTMSILLAAFMKSLENHPGEAVPADQIKEFYLFNRFQNDKLRYKLVLTKSDKETLWQILDGVPLTPPISNQIRAAFNYFSRAIGETEVTKAKIYAALQRLIIVEIVLERNHDDPQLIFESLNSTGLALAQADLIRNFLLMDLPAIQQEALYNQYWFPAERRFGDTESELGFDNFVRDYLTLKTGNIPKISKIYVEFKRFTKNTAVTREEQLRDLYQYSEHYERFALLRETNPSLKESVQDLDELEITVAYPALLELYADLKGGMLAADQLLSILGAIESYVFRRVICGVPTNSLNKTFASIMRKINKINYVESFCAALRSGTTYRRFPGDEEFRAQFVVKDMYNFRSKKYTLRKLEYFQNNERIRTDNLTVEHIMPQNENLAPEWRKDLGENWKETHEKYLHRIGNLTLTGYNPQYSDKPFMEKRDMENGFRHSNLRLNHSLVQLQHWNEQEIISRGNTLAELAQKVWPLPIVSNAALAQFTERYMDVVPQHTLEEFEHLTDDTRALFDELQSMIRDLDSNIQEVIVKTYIVYKLDGRNFICVVPKKNGLELYLNSAEKDLIDPENIAQDVSDVGHPGTGNVGIFVEQSSQFTSVFRIIKQVYDAMIVGEGELNERRGGVKKLSDYLSGTQAPESKSILGRFLVAISQFGDDIYRRERLDGQISLRRGESKNKAFVWYGEDDDEAWGWTFSTGDQLPDGFYSEDSGWGFSLATEVSDVVINTIRKVYGSKA